MEGNGRGNMTMIEPIKMQERKCNVRTRFLTNIFLNPTSSFKVIKVFFLEKNKKRPVPKIGTVKILERKCKKSMIGQEL